MQQVVHADTEERLRIHDLAGRVLHMPSVQCGAFRGLCKAQPGMVSIDDRSM
jgi:hypothetical protein